MRIAIIDSGIDKTHKRLKKCYIEGISILRNNKDYYVETDYHDSLGHGTGVAAIIHKQVPDATLIAVKIFHDDLVTYEDIVCEAIKWCINNKIDIINLSLGVPTSNPLPNLHETCKKAFDKNIPIISAAYKRLNTECYPAYYPEVFGVTGGNIKDKTKFGKIVQFPIEFIAKGDMHRVATKNGGFIFSDGSSYACAYFTGIVASYLISKNFINVAELKTELLNRADENIKPLSFFSKKNNNQPTIIRHDVQKIARELLDNKYKFDWLGRIAVFPTSEKELQTFLQLKHYCKYDIVKYFDYPKIINTNKLDNKYEIQDWLPNEDDLTKFDSLVVGYFHENLFQGNIKFGFEFIERAIKSNKNIFIFDNNLKNIIENEYVTDNYKGKIYCPVINYNTTNKIVNFPYTKKLLTPTLAVIGTGSKQGKFTTQIFLKNLLENVGYKISHISTEPHGELFDSVFSFPIGYNPTVYISQDKWSYFLKSLNIAIEYYNQPDLILSGIQSWTISPYPSKKIAGTELRALHFLLGVQPDAIICAINPNDSIELIQKNIMAAKMVLNTKVIFYTITPYQLEVKNLDTNVNYEKYTLTSNQLQEKIAYYQKELGKPVINMFDTNNNQLIVDTIQDFFS